MEDAQFQASTVLELAQDILRYIDDISRVIYTCEHSHCSKLVSKTTGLFSITGSGG